MPVPLVSEKEKNAMDCLQCRSSAGLMRDQRFSSIGLAVSAVLKRPAPAKFFTQGSVIVLTGHR
jgi:hypothetical protein